MTDTWLVTRTASVASEFNEATGRHEPVDETVYSGPGKLQSFEAYEQTPEAAGHQAVVMRPHLHLPVNDESAAVSADDVAVCTASATDPALVGVTVRVAGAVVKTYMTARRFPVAEILGVTPVEGS